MENERLPYLREKSMRLPLLPGVYIMKNKSGEIIYIGKAKALKNRVSQYFGSQNSHPTKVRKMVENVYDFDVIIVSGEFEALVLECSLIKQHTPKYNILLKDDKGYTYVRFYRGEWYSLSAVKQKNDDGAQYFGPYTSGESVKQAIAEACRIFRVPQCSKKFPRDIKSDRPCLNYYIKQCSAPCAGKITREEHNKNVKNALDLVVNGSKKTLNELRQRMLESSDALDFERAASCRDAIRAIERTTVRQDVVSNKIQKQDVFALCESGQRLCLMVLRFDDGRLTDSESFITAALEQSDEARLKMIIDYYSMRSVPPVISVDGPIADEELLTEFLKEKSGVSVRINHPQRGESAHLVQMCHENASERLAQSLGSRGRELEALGELGTLLGLAKAPEYIEAYDISNTNGDENVCGMVVFENGRPLKSAYRKFRIKSFEGQDDCRSMAEVLSRRFAEYEKHRDENTGFGCLPDLILLDGSHAQINAVRPVMESFGLSIPLFGMVKDGKHRTRAIACDGGEITINDNRRVFTLVSSIQEEVHRYAITFHRSRQSDFRGELALTRIDGIGEKRARALLDRFKTVSAIEKASLDELLLVQGINSTAAKAVYNYFHPEKKMKTAVIFDMDGTILNTLEDLRDSVNHVLAGHGMAPRSLDEIRSFVGNGIPKLVERSVAPGTSQEEEGVCLEEMLDYYSTHNMIKTAPYDGILDVMRALKENGIGMAVVTNKEQSAAQGLLENLFEGLVDVCIGGGIGYPFKPEPQGVWAAVSALGCDEDTRVFYVGDSEVDVMTAVNAGLELVCVAWGFRSTEQLEAAGAEVIADSPAELLAILLG